MQEDSPNDEAYLPEPAFPARLLGQQMAAVAQVAQMPSNPFVTVAWQGIEDYAKLLEVWPAILQAIAGDAALRVDVRTSARC